MPNGDILLNLDYVGLARLDACGNTLWTLDEGNHHSIARAEDGSFWIPGMSSERRATTSQYPDGFPGISQPVWFDRILRVSEGGDILKDINLLDVLYANDLERYLVKALGAFPGDRVRDDPVHLNDVEPLSASMADEYPLFEAGDLVVSLRYPSLVFVFDPETSEVKWHASEPFLHQHDPDFIGGGWIGVFDNNKDITRRGTMLGGSRIVNVQPHTGSVEVRFPTPHSEPFYTDKQGKWQELSNGNMLLAETRAGRVVEVDSSGRTVWEWVNDPYKETRIPVVAQATRHDITPAEVASWPCSLVDSVHTANQN
jgi:hypothetical protein